MTVAVAPPAEPVWLESPLFVAVIESVPIGSCEVVQLAVPLARVPVQRVVVPRVKVTVPVGVPEPFGAVTVALKVTCVPKFDVAGLTDAVVVEGAGPTLAVGDPLGLLRDWALELV